MKHHYDFLLYDDSRPWRKKMNPKKCAARQHKNDDKQCSGKAVELLGEHLFCSECASMIRFFNWQREKEGAAQ
ncbi:MAG: hypothetical protein JW953_08970 [Anaerolineae bacterium]|nr:hypothetical protein [Anaerolineae bacterium]